MHSQPFTLDKVLDELGTFGHYQLRTIILIHIGVMANAVYNSNYVFNAGNILYRCVVPECENATTGKYDLGEWRKWALVPGDNCIRYAPVSVGAKCEQAAFTNTTQGCTAWLYESNRSIVAEFELACHDWKQALVGTIHNVGVFFALSIVGLVSDCIGRRTTFIITATSSAAAGVARAFAPSYIVYLCFEFIDALLGSGSFSTGLVLAVEMIDPAMRVAAGCIISSAFAVGQVVLASVAWAIPHWRTVTLVVYIPAFFFPLYFLLLEESVRWLIAKGRKDKAIAVLLRAAKYNGRHISPETLRHLTEAAEESRKTWKAPKESIVKKVFSSGILMKRLLICTFCWATVEFVYYGMSINSVTLAGNKYVNFILTSLVEIPGYISDIFALDKWGRKTSIMCALAVSGVTLIIIVFIPNDSWFFGLSMAAKFGISMVFAGIYIFSMELFPTSARHSLLNVCSGVGRIGAISAPLSPLLDKYMHALPYLLFGILSLMSAMLLVFVPETLARPLPDTVSQAEDIHISDQKQPEEQVSQQSQAVQKTQVGETEDGAKKT